MKSTSSKENLKKKMHLLSTLSDEIKHSYKCSFVVTNLENVHGRTMK